MKSCDTNMLLEWAYDHVERRWPAHQLVDRLAHALKHAEEAREALLKLLGESRAEYDALEHELTASRAGTPAVEKNAHSRLSQQ